MATHSSVLAWRSPQIEEPGGLQSVGSQGVGHDWAHTRVSVCLKYFHFLVVSFLVSRNTWSSFSLETSQGNHIFSADRVQWKHVDHDKRAFLDGVVHFGYIATPRNTLFCCYYTTLSTFLYSNVWNQVSLLEARKHRVTETLLFLTRSEKGWVPPMVTLWKDPQSLKRARAPQCYKLQMVLLKHSWIS